MKLSLVVPCYNEENNVLPFLCRVREVFPAGDVSVIFVNDGSTDQTMPMLRRAFEEDPSVSVLSFSRNFGKEAAILAGLRAARGDLVGIIDSDLQQDPAVAREMALFLEEHAEYDVVAAYQDGRREGALHRFFKAGFYGLSQALCSVQFYRDASDFRVMRRPVAEAILSDPERDRFSKGIFSYVGFPTHYMPYTVQKRASGKSKWRLSSLTGYALGGIFSYSEKPVALPLLFSVLCGAAAILSFILLAVFRADRTITILLPVTLLLFAAVFFVLWIFGKYLMKTLKEVKARPQYVVRETLEREER